MGKYLKEFELISQYEEYINSDMAILPNVSIINDINGVYYNPKVPNYLKFVAEEDNSTISLNSKTSPDIKYSLNGGDWTQWDYSAITLNTGDTLRMKGNNSNGFSTSNSSYNQFQMTGKIGASGNIMSLLYEDDYEGKLTIPCDYCFYDMFRGCAALTPAPELPATTLADYCYQEMFSGCAALTTAPELPATSLAYSCYQAMFSDCAALTTAPELPATTLTNSCYYGMFMNCSALTTAPELPATTLTNSCYQEMFSGCKSLTVAPVLPATTLMVRCYSSMFMNCSALTTAPELPATTLARYCYLSMFLRCTNLNYIKMLATDISVTNCLNTWVTGVSSTGTFVKDPNMTSLPTGDSGIPEGWTVQDAA